jgi:ATP-dependent Clp protease ATP-binding subunit ClpX
VIEDVMREVMFDLPSRTDVREVVVTADAVDRGVQPLLVLHPEAQEDRRREA